MGLKSIISVAFWLYLGNFATFAQTSIGHQQEGRVSYYAVKFDGRKTASGERFSSQEMTAAHRKLPFNTMIKVTNPLNGRSCIVRINDRGPFTKGRMLDISKSAAEELGIVKAGSATVQLEVVGFDGKITDNHEEVVLVEEDNQKSNQLKERQLEKAKAATALEITERQQEIRRALKKKTEEAEQLASAENFKLDKSYSLSGKEKSPKGFGVQVASFTDLANAEDTAKELNHASLKDVFILVTRSGSEKVFLVLVGAFTERREAKKFMAIIKQAGFKGFVKKHIN